MPEQAIGKLHDGHAIDPPARVEPCAVRYAELDVTTNFSFLRGASHPDELVCQAACLGYHALAITDVNSLAGVVRAYAAAKQIEGFQLIVGTRLIFSDPQAPQLLVWPTDRAAYARLCRLLTLGRRRAPKGECHLTLDDFLAHSDGVHAAVEYDTLHDGPHRLHRLREAMTDRLSLSIHLDVAGDDDGRLAKARAFSRQTRVPLLATNHVHYHDPGRRPLQDVLTCIRSGCTIHDAGFRLFPNAERHLKSPEQMRRLFASAPEAIERGLWVAGQCRFSLGDLKYEYPIEAVPAGVQPMRHLRELTYAEGRKRYPNGIPVAVAAQIEKELAFIERKKIEAYFLTVYDLVREARSRDILCQGRGSAANSAVCYCLGVTSVDPARFQLVFERFASDARDEPPDIDIDFEHERREEVIQYVYDRYGRDHAGMTASLITYRGRSAVRDVGKALGFSQDALDTLAGKLDWWHRGTLNDDQMREAGIDLREPAVRMLIELTRDLLGFPRHLSQHVGGMVLSRAPLCDLVPIENAAMEDRTVIEWDKDDLDEIGLFKVDILALGMLTCLSKAMKLVNAASTDPPLELHTIPAEDEATYDMICDADTIGVFQIESRAQMSMLPRLRPRAFYDLVIEVAIVRPGPIQGDMVHPYLKRREARRADPHYPIDYQHPELEALLEKTLGVPLFQEQAMSIAITAAKFSGAEADALRRAMAAWKRGAGLERFRERFIAGMLGDGKYTPEFADRCFQQICGFGEYGFPESHAASFATLVYASCWLKRHHPAVFACALLNSQPMGFYAPAQIVRDAKEHGVEVRAVDVNFSVWDCTLEPATRCNITAEGKQSWGASGPALRLGFREIRGMRQADAERIALARVNHGPFKSLDHLQRVADLDGACLRRLARADAFSSLNLSRRPATWEALALADKPAPVLGEADRDAAVPPGLPFMSAGEEVLADYATIGLSLKRHPVAFVRDELTSLKVATALDLKDATRFPHGRLARVAGLVLVRQRPGTASGVVFVTLEDETGIVNLILWSHVYERYRQAARHARLLHAEGVVQREGEVMHLLAHRLHDRTSLLRGLHQPSRDFH
ncbi:MAG: error-prone DNA polymerase [Tepidisphaeraceae bacterium]